VRDAYAEAGEASRPLSERSTREILHRLAEGVQRITLSNGLRVLYFRRTQAPVFSAQIWVKVGGVDEVPGVTGVAHMLEHMAFKGSTTIGTKDYAAEKKLLERFEQLQLGLEKTRKAGKKADSETLAEIESLRAQLEELWIPNEFSNVYQRQGGVGLNAATGKDYTYYLVSLPSVAFELWAWMESDRLLNPVFRQFYKERDVVLEERRMRTDDSPGGKLYEALLASAFWTHPNRLPIIGWPSDLANLSVANVENFYRQHYRPDNMVVSLIGDLEPDQVRSTLEKYFGRIPAAKSELPRVTVKEEKQEGTRESTVYFDAEPRFALAYHKPVFPFHKDDLHFGVLHGVLSDGRSSILYRELVKEKQLATSVSSSEAPGERFPNLFYIWASPRHGVGNDKLVAAVDEVLERLKTESIPQKDIDAAKKRIRVDILNTLASNSGLAKTLAHAELLWGDWQVLFEMYDTMLSTDAQDLKRIASTYFTPENRTLVRLERRKKTAVEGK
jgi:predicted Zn-dependent peptidase